MTQARLINCGDCFHSLGTEPSSRRQQLHPSLPKAASLQQACPAWLQQRQQSGRLCLQLLLVQQGPCPCQAELLMALYRRRLAERKLPAWWWVWQRPRLGSWEPSSPELRKKLPAPQCTACTAAQERRAGMGVEERAAEKGEEGREEWEER